MPRYHRRYRHSADPLRELAVTLLSLIATMIIFCMLFWIFSQPNAFRFSFGNAPTPTPLPQSSSSGISGLGWILVLSVLAVLLGGGGLIILGVIWLATRNPRKSRVIAFPSVPPSTTPSPLPPLPSSVPTQPDVQPTVETSVASALSPTSASPAEESKASVEASSLMSGFERSFFWALSKAVQNDYYIFPQIPLRELLHDSQGLARDLRGMLNKGIIDFLLANPTNLEAVIAFEFDDPSHLQADAQARDRRKEEFLRYVGIPLLRFRSGDKWSADSLRQQIVQVAESRQSIPFLDDSECSLFKALRQTRDDLCIFPKVPLKQIIRRKERLSIDAYNTWENESVDFLLAHPRYLGTLLVVEINDSDYSDKANLLKQAGIRRLCISEMRIPSADELRLSIAQALDGRV